MLERVLNHFRQHGLPYQTSGLSALTVAAVRALLRVGHRLSVRRDVALLPESADSVPVLGFLALRPESMQARPGAAVFSAPVLAFVLDEVFVDAAWTQVRPTYLPVVSSLERMDVEELAEVIAQSPDLSYAVDLLVSLAELGRPFPGAGDQQAWQRQVEVRHPHARRVQLGRPERIPR